MKHALVFGKFLPFHIGHAALIEFARRHSTRLTVLVCASDQETVPGEVRAAWIRETYAAQPEVEVQVLEYREQELANTSETSLAVAQAWADRFREVLPEVTLVVTSEPYGALVAARMGIEYLDFDVFRAQVPVSGTAIRGDVRAGWAWLPASVQRHYQRTVAILGTESTGKTTLAEQLAKHFKAVWVPEAGRDLIPDSTDFRQEQLLAVAAEHARRIAEVRAIAGPLLLLDTDVHITQSYARLLGQEYLTLPPGIYQQNRADLYLYLAPDVPLVQDGTRLPGPERTRLEALHRQTLADFNIAYYEISGGWAERWAQAVTLIETQFRLEVRL
ncbi:AAA family ATPase [Hymenobacter endophyticus]|uniref:AAA family ATPase n=1 Tax=Hymenobacter endophyticus TaxID=3076335 RepID=A0ABU3TJI7_9BACT|nr:AAA family ATPase [Hymenobacter endophyticus]MDU0371385.1 AAA family ATPase [Hymenobacter endophyticus]